MWTEPLWVIASSPMDFFKRLVLGAGALLPLAIPHLPTASAPCQHTLEAFEQGDWLAELDLLQLGQSLQLKALRCGGYDGHAFDLMVAIADVLESDHGWNLEQSEAWLTRMGLWEEEL